MIRGQHIEIDCPKCEQPVSVTLAQAAGNEVVRCSCGQEIELHDEGGRIGDAVKAGGELDRALKDLGGTIKF